MKDSDLVEAIRNAPLSPESWQEILAVIGQRIRRTHLVCGRQIFPSGMEFLGVTGLSDETCQIVASRHGHTAERLARFINTPDGIPFNWDRGRLNETPEFRRLDDLLQSREGVVQEAAVPIGRNANSMDIVAAFRIVDQPPMDPSALAFLANLAPHLRRSLALSAEFARLNRVIRCLADALEQTSTGLCVLSRERRLLQANATAERLLGAGDGLSARYQRVSADCEHDQKWLAAEVLAACDGVSGESATRIVRRPRSGFAPFRVTVAESEPGTAVMSIISPMRLLEDNVGTLVGYAGLSRMQAEVACRVATGSSTANIAGALGISTHTARTHAQRAMTKLDCRDSRELTLIVASLLAQSDPGKR